MRKIYSLLFHVLYQFPDSLLKSPRVARLFFSLLYWVADRA